MTTEEEVLLPPSLINPPARFRVVPSRVGRHSDVEPFEIGLGSHFQSTPDVLALRISREIGRLLVSREYAVKVDLGKMQFRIDGGRFGGGYIERID